MTNPVYLPSAPEDLVKDHRERQVAKGYKKLELLVTHHDMERVWQELHKRATPEDKDHGKRLFSEIVFILHDLKHKVRIRRSDEKDKYLTIAKRAEELASMTQDGVFDQLAYEYFPADIMETNGFPDWGTQDGLIHSIQTRDVLTLWPSLPEVLRELAAHATKQANTAMTRPLLVQRKHSEEKYRDLYFVRALSAYFVKEYGSSLYGTVASIASVILDTVLTKQDVERLTRGSN